MTTHLPRLPFALDPLIGEAKQRARRRRLVALAVIFALAAAVSLTLATRSSAPTANRHVTDSGHQVSVDEYGTRGGVTWAFTQAHLWLSDNDGRTWRISHLPPHVAAVDVGQIRFADPRHGLFLTDWKGPPVSHLTQTYRTTDGGRSWHRTTPTGCRPGGCGYSFSFITATHGYLFGAGKLWTTDNGGATWTLLSRPTFTQESGTIRFLNGQVGFLSLGEFMPGQRIYRTEDGGHTWKPLPFCSTSCAVAAPLWAHGPHLVVGTVRYLNEGQERRLVVNSSDDSGRSWRSRSAPWLTNGYPDLQVVAPTRWIVYTNPGKTFVTTDGGRTWSRHTGVSDTPRVDPSSPRDGWRLSPNFVLQRTTDGGRHWVPAGPRVPRKAHNRR